MRDRVEGLLNKKARLQTLRDQVVGEIAVKEAEVESLAEEQEVLTKVLELYRNLTNQLVEKHVSLVERVGTQGLKTVFHDRDLSLEADVDFKRNQVSVDLFFRKGSKEDEMSYLGEPLEAFGGGPTSLVSFILRVLAAKKLGLYPMFILDESMAAVSDKYIGHTSQFIRKLTESLGLDVLLVTHKQAFTESSNTYYDCSSTVAKDGLESCVFKRRLS